VSQLHCNSSRIKLLILYTIFGKIQDLVGKTVSLDEIMKKSWFTLYAKEEK